MKPDTAPSKISAMEKQSRSGEHSPNQSVSMKSQSGMSECEVDEGNDLVLLDIPDLPTDAKLFGTYTYAFTVLSADFNRWPQYKAGWSSTSCIRAK